MVNAANPISTLSKSTANDIFLKRSVRWDDGQAAAPVNLDRASAARDAFSRAVHGKSVSAVESFWQGQIFAGKETPPPTRARTPMCWRSCGEAGRHRLRERQRRVGD